MFAAMGIRVVAWARMGMHGRAWCVYTLPRLKDVSSSKQWMTGRETRSVDWVYGELGWPPWPWKVSTRDLESNQLRG